MGIGYLNIFEHHRISSSSAMVTWEVSSAAIAWMFMAPNKNGDDLGMVQMAWGNPQWKWKYNLFKLQNSHHLAI